MRIVDTPAVPAPSTRAGLDLSVRLRSAGDGRPTRALIVTSIYPWAGNPNEGIFVHRQVRHLVAAGIDCRVLLFRGAVRGLPACVAGASRLRYHPRWMTWPDVLDGVPVDLVFHPRSLRPGDLVPAAVEALSRRLDQRGDASDVDVILGHWLWPGGSVALRLGERLRRPVAALARGSELHAWLDRHTHCRRHVVDVLERADLLLANCDGLRRRAAALTPRCERSREVVYNGCDVRQFHPLGDARAARRAVGLPADRRFVLFCGGVQRSKGVFELADAWERVAASLDGWELLAVGPLTETAAARRLRDAARRTGGRVRLVGPVDADRVTAYMQAADALVHPTHAEGLANATLEAMACGLPVISSAVDGQPELVEHGETGWLIAPHDAAALAHALRAMAADPVELIRRGANARRRAVAHFDARRHASRLAALLADLAERPTRRTANASR